MAEMVRRQILPAATEFAGKMAASYDRLASIGTKNDSVFRLTARLSDLITAVDASTGKLEKALARCESAQTLLENAEMHRDEVRAVMADLRRDTDAMERLVSAGDWPMPTYTDLLYRV